MEEREIIAALANAGVHVTSVYDLVNTRDTPPNAIPVLLHCLVSGIENIRTKEGVVRALATKEAKGIASSILLQEYLKTPENQASLRWAIGNTIYVTATIEDIKKIISIIENKMSGTSRQMLVLALGKLKSKESEDILISLLDDEEVAAHAIVALRKIKSEKANAKIEALSQSSKKLIKKEALKFMEKLV